MTEAAGVLRLGSVGRQIVRDWVVRFNERGPDGLLDGKAPGTISNLMMLSVKPLQRSWIAGRMRRSMRSSAGGWSIW